MLTFLLSCSCRKGTPRRFPLPPPVRSISENPYPKYIQSSSNEHSNERYNEHSNEHNNGYTWSSNIEQESGFHYAYSTPSSEHSPHSRVGFCFLSALTHTCDLFVYEIVNHKK